MRRLTLALDSLPALRHATDAPETGLGAAATLAELAGVYALRLGVGEDLRPVREADVMELRRAARVLELRMSASASLLKVALEARPDRVILCSGGREGPGTVSPLEPKGRDGNLAPILRSLEEARIPVAALVTPAIEAVKQAHGLGVTSVELYTGATVDLPPTERRAQLERLGDAVRLASKLRMEIGVSGGLGFDSVSEVLSAAAACDRVAAGRSLVSRALLVGLDRCLRDFRQLVE